MTSFEMDLALAIQMQAQFEEEIRVRLSKESEAKSNEFKKTGFNLSSRMKNLYEPNQKKLSIPLVDPSWEMLDPTPNILDLFLTYNDQFFWGRLAGIEVKWSPRMTLCAGVCSYERRGGLCSVRLSTPLLKLRPRKDLVETLLHEMIHAYLFITDNNTDHDGHGEQFHKHMYRINNVAGTKISVYHSFHDEVAVYKQHVWQCNGSCRLKPPYFGLVKRSMNRAPGPNDRWWSEHQGRCGGTYHKIKEPTGFGTKKKLKKNDTNLTSTSVGAPPKTDIRKYFSPTKENNEPTINGFGSSLNTGGMKVGSSGIKNSANIFGFNKTGIGGARPKNNKDGIKSKNPPKNSGSSFRGGTKTKYGGGGSSTTTVKRKSPTKEETKDKINSDSSNVNTMSVFKGKGHSLGGIANARPGVSKLLTKFSSNSQNKTENSDNRETKTISATSSSSPVNIDMTDNEFVSLLDDEPEEEEPTECPLCNQFVPPGTFDQHISDCVGDDLDDYNDEAILLAHKNIEEKSESRLKDFSSMASSSKFSSSSPSSDEIPTTCFASPEVKLIKEKNNGKPVNLPIIIDDACSVIVPGSEEMFPCPICSKKFPESIINMHVSRHFD